MTVFTDDLLNVVNSGLNTIYLGFYMDLYGCRAGCQAWSYMSDSQRKQVLDSGMDVILSAGGEGESIHRMIREKRGSDFATEVANHAKQTNVNGIDYLLHLNGQPSEPLIEHVSGQYINFVQEIITTTKSVAPDLSISITAPGPYFSEQFAGLQNSLGYLLSKNPDISANLIMTNQGDYYETKQDIFFENTNGFARHKWL